MNVPYFLHFNSFNISIYMYIYTIIRTCTCIALHMYNNYACKHVCTCMNVYINVHIYMYVCIIVYYVFLNSYRYSQHIKVCYIHLYVVSY